MNRRGFLAAMLAASAAPAIVRASSLMPIWVPRDPSVVVWTMDDLIRESSAYDIYGDRLVVRYDILVAASTPMCSEQFGVDMQFPDMEAARAFGAKALARDMFDKELRHKGRSWADVRPLSPAPHSLRMRLK